MSDKTCMPSGQLYFHVNNGGVTATVSQGPTGVLVALEGHHFGIVNSRVAVSTTPAGLRALGDFFHAQAQLPYSYSEFGVAEHPFDPSQPRPRSALSGATSKAEYDTDAS